MRRGHKQSDLPKAIVIGLEAGGVAIGRILKRLGFNVLGFYWDQAEPGRASNCFSRVLRIPREPNALAEIPQNIGPAPIPVFLTLDKALIWSRHHKNLDGGTFHFFQPEERIYQTWFQKTRLADVNGALADMLNPPHSTPLIEYEEFTRDCTGPWIIKPADSVVGAQHKIAKIQFIPNERELRSVADKYGSIGDSILLQEWIPGADDQHAFVGGYVDQKHRISIVQVGRKLKQYPPGMGVSIHSKLESIPELKTRSRETLETIGHRGFFEFEWKWDARINQWRFIEINLRPWATLALSPGYGLRLIQKCLDDIGLVMDVEAPKILGDPVEWIDDFSVALQAIRFRSRYPLRFNRHIAHAYWDRSDPRPLFFQWSRLITSKFGRH